MYDECYAATVMNGVGKAFFLRVVRHQFSGTYLLPSERRLWITWSLGKLLVVLSGRPSLACILKLLAFVRLQK